MTQIDFDDTKWSSGMKMVYENEKHNIVSVDFHERLIAFDAGFDNEVTWVRCENAELIK